MTERDFWVRQRSARFAKPDLRLAANRAMAGGFDVERTTRRLSSHYF
jgi:hypothetical protein